MRGARGSERCPRETPQRADRGSGCIGADREQLLPRRASSTASPATCPKIMPPSGDIRKRHPLGKVGSVALLFLFALLAGS